MLTGVFYLDNEKKNFLETLDLVDQPLVHLGQERVRPTESTLAEIMEELR